MNLIPFRKKRDQPKPSTVRYVRFKPVRELAEYGFDGAKPKKQEGTASGFLLPWAGIDAERDRRAHGGSCQLVVEGEYIDSATGMHWPALAVNADWMDEHGFYRAMTVEDGRVRYGPWKIRDSLTTKSA